MTPKEQEIAIKELEERVDRLRNIYEQYFLGFERLEPTVPRKDVDRRFAILRKEQIRNTAMRFRFNVVTQKYNTYAMHWIRICRQIEEGTYKRHLRRAKARFGDLASAPERELSIDVDIGDFDVEMDMDEVLAEANAAAEGYQRPPPDTLPPPPSERAAASVRAVLATPGTSFAIAGRREGRDPHETPTPPPSTAMRAAPDRAARPAALPPGAKARVVRKREDGDQAPPSVRLPPPSSSHFVSGNPASAPGPRIAPVAPSSAGRPPVSPPGAPSGPQIRPLGSGGRLPAAAPAPAPGPGAPRGPAPPPSRPDPAYRPPIPPPSGPRLPVAPASSPRLPAPPPPRAPMPSYIEKDTDPGAPHARPPGTRPRAPLPLPSQSTRPTKKE